MSHRNHEPTAPFLPVYPPPPLPPSNPLTLALTPALPPYPPRTSSRYPLVPPPTPVHFVSHRIVHVQYAHTYRIHGKTRHFAAWRVNEESIMRSFCAGLRASTLANGRGFGDDQVSAAARKRKRIDSLDIVPPSPEFRANASLSSASSSVERTLPRPSAAAVAAGRRQQSNASSSGSRAGFAEFAGGRGSSTGAGVAGRGGGRGGYEEDSQRSVPQLRIPGPALAGGENGSGTAEGGRDEGGGGGGGGGRYPSSRISPRDGGRGGSETMSRDSQEFVTGEQVCSFSFFAFSYF